MCCIREHYPSEVGLFSVDSNCRITTTETGHYHIILPWDLMSGICLSLGYVNWRNFKDNPSTPSKMESVLWNIETRDLLDNQIYLACRKILAIGIAEGGRVSEDFIRTVLQKFKPELEFSIKRTINPEIPEWKIEPPESLEYYEWLVLQTKKEMLLKP